MPSPSDDPLFGNRASDLFNAAADAQATANVQDWQPPTPEVLQDKLPAYKVLALIGRGGMGAVYRGVQISLDREVAIKILPPQLLAADPHFAERFKQEAQAMARFSHPNIISVFDFGQMADGTLFFVMEFIDGTDVAQMIQQQGRLSSAHAMAITAHVCDALQCAHEHGVIHRDIKPANIIVGYDGRVKVADFGLAKSGQNANTSLTVTGHVMGTPHYVAPEALTLGVSIDHRADIYAVGVMLYQMLTGKLPQGLFEMPSLKVPGLDPRYDHIIASAMREDRDQRYQRIRDMRRALDAILTQPVQRQESLPSSASPGKVVLGPTQPKPRAVNPPRPPQAAKLVPLVGRKSGKMVWLLSSAIALGLAAMVWIQSYKPGAATKSAISATQSSQGPDLDKWIGNKLVNGSALPGADDEKSKNLSSHDQSNRQQGITPERKSVQRIEGEVLGIVSITGGKAEPRNDVGGFTSAVWSGGSHLWWGNGKKGDTLVLHLPVKEGGRQRIKALFTVARDGGIVAVTLDGKPVPGSPFDLQAEEITHAGTADWGVFDLSAGDHELKFTLVGTHGSAVALGDSCVGLDFVQLEPLSIVPTSVAVGTDIAPSARPSASNCSGGDHVKNINAGKEPATPSSSHSSRMTWFPRKGGLEWVQYEWETPQVTNECRVVWFANQDSAMPMFWRLLYREESGAWVPVAASIPNAVPDQWNVVKFPTVKTTALRISAQCKEEWAAGICHWQVIAADPYSVTDPQLRPHPDLFLGDISPLHSQVGWSIYHVNYVFENDRKNGAGITVGTTLCDQFIWAHPESRIEFAIPSGYTRFRATGVTSNPTVWFLGSWKYLIQVDGKTVLESKELNTYKDKQLPMEVVLPPGSKRLTLITDSCGEKNWDGAYWAGSVLIADPSITAGAASAPVVEKTERSTAMSADSGKPISQSLAGSTKEQLPTSNPPPTPAIVPSQPSTKGDDHGFTVLLDAAHTNGWHYYGKQGPRIEDDAVTLPGEGKSFYWYEQKNYADFVLRMEFKVSSSLINAGVFIRSPKVPGNGWGGYEVEIHGAGTGSFPFGGGSSSQSSILRFNDWNTMEIKAVAEDIVVTVNGKHAGRFPNAKNLSGYIGLQQDEGEVQFRSIRIKEGSTSNDATSQALSTIEQQFRAAFDREAEKMVNADFAALDKSLMANGFPQAIAEAQRRNASADAAALIKEHDRFLTTRVIPPADTPDVHPAVAKLRTKYRDARKAVEGGRNDKPVPPALYESYLRELTKTSLDSARLDVAKIKARYQEIAKAAGFETVPLPANATVEWQSRCGSARREKLAAYGAKPGADAATGRALEFLAARQNPDGAWGSDNRCGVTGLSLLAFLGRCETTESMAYSDVVLKAAMFLIEVGRKNRDGLLSESPASPSAAKEHAIATTALGELYQTGRSGLKTLPGLREVYETAVGLILRHRLNNQTWAGKNGGNGYWERSEPEPRTKDFFTTAWNLQALKIALESDVKDKEISGVLVSSVALWSDFRNATPQSDGTNPDAQMAAAIFGLLYVTENLRVSIGQGTNAIVESVYETKPQWADADLAAWYFATMTMTLEGGRKWKVWNETAMPVLIASQSSTGSWQRPRAVFSASEVECTALGALMLESCFRIPPRNK